jgi:hypothetical protein
MINEFEKIKLWAEQALQTESRDELMKLAKRISYDASDIITELKNSDQHISQIEKDMRWVVSQLSQRHIKPFVWWKDNPEFVGTGFMDGVKVPYTEISKAAADRNHPTEIEEETDRLWSLIFYIEKLAELPVPIFGK